MDILVSIITVNYNGAAVTGEMIDSVTRYCNPDTFEIIVVDNASKGGDAAWLSARYPKVKILANTQNEGFAGGNNRGIAVAKGKYLLLLNNDTTVKEDFLTPLIARMETDSSIGALSPQLRYEYAPQIIQYAGFTPLSPITLRNQGVGCGASVSSVSFPAAPTAFAHGAAMMVRRSLLDSIGGMPECYFLYYEEMDWCEIIRRNGWTIWYDPASVVYHKESASTGSDSPLKCYYLLRNRFLFALRNRTGILRCMAWGYLTVVVTPKELFKHLLKRELPQLRASWAGVCDAFRHKWGKRPF